MPYFQYIWWSKNLSHFSDHWILKPIITSFNLKKINHKIIKENRNARWNYWNKQQISIKNDFTFINIKLPFQINRRIRWHSAIYFITRIGLTTVASHFSNILIFADFYDFSFLFFVYRATDKWDKNVFFFFNLISLMMS